MSDSIAFDRAAEYYDATRGLSDEGVRYTTEALAEVFRGAGPILEVGVGTGQVAVPVHAAGVRVVGVDLSRPMLGKLLAKAGGAPTFPLVEGDATRQPFIDDAFGGAYLRWVLHLIPDGEPPCGNRAHPRRVARSWRPSAPTVATGRRCRRGSPRSPRHLDRTGRPGMERVGPARRRSGFGGDAEAPRHRVHRSGPGRPRAFHGRRSRATDSRGRGPYRTQRPERPRPPRCAAGRGTLGTAERDPHPKPSSGSSPSTDCLDRLLLDVVVGVVDGAGEIVDDVHRVHLGRASGSKVSADSPTRAASWSRASTSESSVTSRCSWRSVVLRLLPSGAVVDRVAGHLFGRRGVVVDAQAVVHLGDVGLERLAAVGVVVRR